jgi:dienelactone hydrolase
MTYRLLLLVCLGSTACSYLPEPENRIAGLTENRTAIVIPSTRNPQPTTGLLLYPGGLVDPHAYITLARQWAESGRGYRVVIAKVPSNLAVLDANAAPIFAQHPDLTAWVIAGHSLGGTMAARWVARNPDSVRGLVLLAAYPAGGDDLSGWPGAVLSMYGSEDGVLNRDNLANAQAKLPPGTVTEIIAGGNHAQFGAYGTQNGDGVATISRQEQFGQTTAALQTLLNQLGL